MKESDAYKEMLKNIDSFLNKKGTLMHSRFIRSNFNYIEQILNQGFQLKEITDNLTKNLNSEVNYSSFWNSYNRHLKKINKKAKPIIENFKIESNPNDAITKKEESVSDEIKDSEKNIELDWIKKPRFEHLNKKQIIETIIKYGITEQEVINLNLPLYTLKCLDLLINYGEKKKSKEIGKLYFGN